MDPISDIPPSLHARENKVSSSSSILSFPNPRRFIILSPPQHSRTEKKRKGLCSSLYLGCGDPTFGFPFIFYRFLPFFRSVCPPPLSPRQRRGKKRECCTAGHGGGGGGTKQEFSPPLPHPSSILCFPTSLDPRFFCAYLQLVPLAPQKRVKKWGSVFLFFSNPENAPNR